MFNGSKGIAIHGGAHSTVGRDQNVNAYEVHGNMTNVYHNEGISKDLDDPISEAALKVLAQKAAPNACYDSEQRFPPPNCHPGTRASILGKMSDWIEDNSKPTRVFWLHGSAGVGKSAIAQSLAEKYAGERLAATFFFSRNDETRDRLASFVASIAYQFCKSGSPLRPVLGPFIVETIHSDPNLFHTSCESQFQALIVEPCSKLELEEWGNFPNTIIIDGLDECIDHPSQDRLLAIIRKVTAPPFRLPWLFLIFSRPEVQIRYAFDHEDFGAVLVPLAIQPSDEASQDIREYLVDQFNELRRKYRSILHHEGLSWPSDEAIDQLVKRADGQFIFVITVIKYIDTHDENPQDRLNVILRIYVDPDSESPYSDLDLLYHQILSTCKDWEKAQPILRLLVTPHAFAPGLSSVSNISWRSPEMVALLLNLQMGQVRTILSRLHSVLQIPEDNYHDIHIAHGSFTEFLSDPNRSRGYHTPQVPRLEYCDCVAVLLLRTISTSKPRYFPFPPQSNFMAAFSSWKALLQNDKVELMKYSSDHWYEYCKAVKSPSADLFAALSELDPYLALAVSMFYRPLPYLPEWESVLYWIKSFRERTQHFVRISQRTLVVLSVGADVFGGFDLSDFRGTLLETLYSIKGRPDTSMRGHAFLILAADMDTMVPEDWITVHVAKSKGALFARVSNVLYAYDDGPEVLLEDIRDGTRNTVMQNWINEDDLVHLKSLLKERAKIFGIPLRPRTIETRGTKRKRK